MYPFIKIQDLTFSPLSLDVMELASLGYQESTIAALLGIKYYTVNNVLKRAYKKLQITGKVQLILLRIFIQSLYDPTK